MELQSLHALYFSPTGTTQRTVTVLAEALAATLALPLLHTNFTSPALRTQSPRFSRGDLVVLGVPVYAGRVPNLILPYIAAIEGAGALAVPLVLYGNRAFDDALIELRNTLQAGGFSCLAAAAFVGEHSFSRDLGHGRPDACDLARARSFAQEIAKKLVALPHVGALPPLFVDGTEPIPPHYRPADKDGKFMDLRKAKPTTSASCTDCGLCATRCPMGSIDTQNTRHIPGVCIKCNACVRYCPEGAKSFTDPSFLFHRDDLLARYASNHCAVRTYL